MIAESAIAPHGSVIGSKIDDSCITKQHVEQYRQGQTQVVEDIEVAQLPLSYVNFLKNFALEHLMVKLKKFI